MAKRIGVAALAAGLLCAFGAQPADARVVRIEVERTTPHAGGKAFGDAGPFERLDGVAHMEVDPDDPRNAVIVNLDRAPRNERGLVEFSAPFFIIKPVDLARGNRKLLYGINNRGNPIELGFQTFPPLPPGADPDTADGLVFRLGYSFVDAGWAGDVVTTESRNRLGANLPVAVQADGSPIVSRIRIEYPSDPLQPIADSPGGGYTVPLKGNDRFVSYADRRHEHGALDADGARRHRRSAPDDSVRPVGVRHVSDRPRVAGALGDRPVRVRRLPPGQGVRPHLSGQGPLGDGTGLRRDAGSRVVPALPGRG